MESPRARPDVQLHTHRCPYCHADVDLDHDDAWVSCRGCLARHHGPCWDEHGACAACGEQHRMEAAGQPIQIERLRAGPAGAWPLLLILPMIPALLGLNSFCPPWLGVVFVSLMVTITLQKLLSPVLALDPGGVEIRYGLRSIDVRYADVETSKPGLFPASWTLVVRKPGGGTRTLELPLYELRAPERAKVRAILERLPRQGPAPRPPAKPDPKAQAD